MEHFEINDKLYAHQLLAVETIKEYMGDDQSTGHALVKMPTGTGKTAVIAYAACLFDPNQTVLVITTSIAVKNQLIEDIRSKTWKDLGLEETIRTKEVLSLSPSNIEELNRRTDPSVFLTTAQALEQIERERPDDFAALSEKVDLILFDEGHREPAFIWRQVIDQLCKKIVLLTATPIRNDSNSFKIDKRYISNYSFQNAIQDSHIRQVEFKEIERKTSGEVAHFLAAILQEHKVICQTRPNAKVIIRCGTPEQIKIVVELLHFAGERSIVAVHHSFRNEGVFLNYVPDVRTNEATFWIHQYMLLEGVDNHEFSLLGILHPLDNARMLVQQVGRVIRRGKRQNQEVETASVLYLEMNYLQKEWWESYLKYEEEIGRSKELIILDFEDVLQKMMVASPKTLYTQGQFLNAIQFPVPHEDGSFRKLYKVPLKTNMFELYPRGTDYEAEGVFEEIAQYIREELELHPVLTLDTLQDSDRQEFAIIYAYYRNSPILSKQCFLEISLGVLVFKIAGNILYYFDTHRITPKVFKGKYAKLSSNELKKMFNPSTKFMSVSIKNGLITDNGMRRLVMYSKDLGRVPTNITHSYHYITTAQGNHPIENTKRSIRRYVGFKNARISESQSSYSLEKYFDWLSEVESLLSQTQEDIPLFKRYAAFNEVPNHVEPITIVITLNEYENEIGLEKTFYEVNDSVFELTIRDQTYRIGIEFNRPSRTYELRHIEAEGYVPVIYEEGCKLDSDDAPIAGEDLVDYLNETQAFQLLLEDREIVYDEGEFFRIGIPSDVKKLDEFTWEYELSNGTLNKEKGTYYKEAKDRPVVRSMWEDNSLFQIIASKAVNLKDEPEGMIVRHELASLNYLFCTDLGNEVADFVGVNTVENKVIFIHCKCDKGSWLSVQAFYDVCAQIKKNLDYVHPSSLRQPDFTRWGSHWDETPYSVRVDRMIEGEQISPEEFWNMVKEVQRRPGSRTMVWAFMGGALSMAEYHDEKRKDRGSQEKQVIQLEYLLSSTQVLVHEVGAEFRVITDKR